MTTATPKLDDGTATSLDDVAARIRRALRELQAIAEVGIGAEVHLLEAEQAMRRALRAIRAE